MNLNIKIFLLCPVPDNQKPINEYIGLKENFLTNWTTFSEKNYQKLTIIIFTFFFAFFFFLSFSLMNTFFLSTFFTSFFFLILFFRWYQIKPKFESSRLFYEEASWYDGQIWEKPFLLIKNDKLIQSQKIQPILQRISRSLLLLFYSLIFLKFL